MRLTRSSPSLAVPLLPTSVKGVPEMEVPQKEKIKGFQLYHEIYIKKRELFSGLNVLDT